MSNYPTANASALAQQNALADLKSTRFSVPKRRLFTRHPECFTALLILFVSLIVGAINPNFFQIATLFDILRSSTVTGLFALGVLMVLAAGGIDVSFTAIAALCLYAITKAVLFYFPSAPFFLILAAGAIIGGALGAVNGFLVHYLKAPSLIVTIGTQYFIRGFLLSFIGTVFFMVIPESMDGFGRIALIEQSTVNNTVAILPASVLVLFIAAGITWFILNRTLMGRAVYALGGNLSIAERLGYNLRVAHVFVFGYVGMLAGIAGIVHASTIRIANPFDLVGSEIDVIAAVVLGGAKITGGTGTVLGTLLGVVLVTLINNVLILAGVPSTWQKVVIGAFILLAGVVFSGRAK